MTYRDAFLAMWIGFALLTLSGIGAVLWWTIKSGQFEDQDRARYLPLMSGIPDETEEKDREEGKKEDKCSATSTRTSVPSGH